MTGAAEEIARLRRERDDARRDAAAWEKAARHLAGLASGEAPTPARIDSPTPPHASTGFANFSERPAVNPGLPEDQRARLRAANPFARETFNLTEQMKLIRRDPAFARELETAVRK